MAESLHHHTRGDALYEAGAFEPALAAYEAALAADPAGVAAQFNIGNTLRQLKRYRESIAAYDATLALAPDFPMARHNRATCLLHLGEWAEGFAAYESRKDAPGFAEDSRQGLPRPWTGEDLRGRTLFIFAELFLGDLIQFCRYALLAERVLGARVILSAPPAMRALLSTLSPTIRLIEEDAPAPDYDFQCGLMSLPHLCRTTVKAVPALPSYLAAEPGRVARWRERIGAEGLKIGIAWQGTARIAHRAFPLALAAERLAAIPGVRLISLQKGHGLDQLAALRPGLVQDLGPDFDPGPDLFVDTAAAMMCCDRVVSLDTSVAHLAGALGRPTELALSWAGDWRWLEDRADSPWYPSLRIHRQPAPGDWAPVFEGIARSIGA